MSSSSSSPTIRRSLSAAALTSVDWRRVSPLLHSFSNVSSVSSHSRRVTSASWKRRFATSLTKRCSKGHKSIALIVVRVVQSLLRTASSTTFSETLALEFLDTEASWSSEIPGQS